MPEPVFATPTRYRLCVLLPLFMAMPAIAQEAAVDPQADAVLRAMSDYMAGQRAFGLVADASTEVLLQDGRKVQLTATSRLTMDRDRGLRVERQGALGSSVAVYDGNVVSIHSEREGVYLSLPAPGGMDAALDEVRAAIGSEVVGGADLLYADVYGGLMLNVVSGDYMGKAWVAGVLTDHLSYRADDIDWQLWVRSDGDPVPVRYVVTSKWMTAAPQFTVQIAEFAPIADVPGDTFAFAAPAGARLITLDELPEFDLLAEE